MDNLTQQLLGVKAKSQCFQESQVSKRVKVPTNSDGRRRSALSYLKVLPTHPDDFTSSDWRLLRVTLGGAVLGTMGSDHTTKKND